MIYSEAQRQQIAAEAVGKRIAALEWDEVEHYWVMMFDTGSEICFRFMAELAR